MENTSKKKKILKAYLYNSLAVLGVIALFSIVGSGDSLMMKRIITIGSINAIAAVSLNLVSGCLGEMVLGHGGFMFIGALAAGIITRYLKVSDNLMQRNELQPSGYVQLLLIILSGGVAAGIVGLIVGMPILRLKGDYLAIVTLGFTLIMKNIGDNIVIGEKGDGKSVYIDGAQGIIGLRDLIKADAFFIVLVMVVVIAALYLYMKTRYGREILSIRDDHTAAEASGVNVKKVRLQTFVISSIVAGIAGALLATQNGILPSMMSIDRSIEVLIIVVLGGLGSFTGSVISAFFITIVSILLTSFGNLQKLIYAIILLIVMLVKPTGLFGTKEFSWKGLFNLFKKIGNAIVHPIATLKLIGNGIKNTFVRLIRKIKTNAFKGGSC